MRFELVYACESARDNDLRNIVIDFNRLRTSRCYHDE